MPINTLFPRGNDTENIVVESLIIESIKAYGYDWYYIPRTLVDVDQILGEDPLSKFKDAYLIEAYIDNVDGFAGQGAFMSKFGFFIEEQAQLTIARKRWEQLVGQYGKTILPNRPTEGDLLYFLLSKGLFEIKFVDHQNPFYQLGRLHVYKLKIELFQYSSERIETDVDDINKFALDMTFDIINTPTEHATPTHREFGTNTELTTEAQSIINFDESNPFGN